MKEVNLFLAPVQKPAPVYELPNSGGVGESELNGEETERTPVETHGNSPLGREELISRDAEGGGRDLKGGFSGRFGGHN